MAELDGKVVNIEDIRPGCKGVTCVFIVLDVGELTNTKDGHKVRTVRVADKTGSINVSVWDEWSDLIRSGDICRLTRGYASLWKRCLTLYTGRVGVLEKLGDFCLVFSETPFMSEAGKQFEESNSNTPTRSSVPKAPSSTPRQPTTNGVHDRGSLSVSPATSSNGRRTPDHGLMSRDAAPAPDRYQQHESPMFNGPPRNNEAYFDTEHNSYRGGARRNGGAEAGGRNGAPDTIDFASRGRSPPYPSHDRPVLERSMHERPVERGDRERDPRGERYHPYRARPPVPDPRAPHHPPMHHGPPPRRGNPLRGGARY